MDWILVIILAVLGLSWDAMLEMTGVELELISGIGMYLFIEKGTREGISSIAKRYYKTNNKYIKSYDYGKPSKYIIHFDAIFFSTPTQIICMVGQ